MAGVGLKPLILGWWGEYSIHALTPWSYFRLWIYLYLCLFIPRCQWQEQDSNPWSWDDVSSVLPLRYHHEPNSGKEFISFISLPAVAAVGLKPLIFWLWGDCPTTMLLPLANFKQGVDLYNYLPFFLLVPVALVVIKPLILVWSEECFSTVLLPLANFRQEIYLLTSANFFFWCQWQ